MDGSICYLMTIRATAVSMQVSRNVNT